MQKPFIVGVTGTARSGKNTFCDLLQQELLDRLKISSSQLSFAYTLRQELEDFTRYCGYSIWREEDKEKLRPLMVWYAGLKREDSKGMYFIDNLKKQVERLSSVYNVFLINDARFAAYEYDEADYCKENGILVHISKYRLPDPERSDIKWFDTPPNSTEAYNDPKIKAKSDYQISWKHQDGDVGKLTPHITKFVDWLEPKLK